MIHLARYIGKICNRFLLVFIIIIGSINAAQLFGIDAYIVRSGSMEPAILTGSLCMVDTDYEFEKIQVNDVVVFELSDTLITHRVKKITKEGFITKGDNNQVDDGVTTTEKNFVGKNLMAIPYAGYLISWIQTRKGKIISISILISGFILGTFFKETID